MKKNSVQGVQSQFKVALNPKHRIFLNFAKSCVLSKVENIKKFHRAVF